MWREGFRTVVGGVVRLGGVTRVGVLVDRIVLPGSTRAGPSVHVPSNRALLEPTIPCGHEWLSPVVVGNGLPVLLDAAVDGSGGVLGDADFALGVVAVLQPRADLLAVDDRKVALLGVIVFKIQRVEC